MAFSGGSYAGLGSIVVMVTAAQGANDMTKLTELIKLADAATAFCNKCGYVGKDEPQHAGCDYQAIRLMYMEPATVKRMAELLKQCRKSLQTLDEYCREYYAHEFQVMLIDSGEALAALDEFDGEQ